MTNYQRLQQKVDRLVTDGKLFHSPWDYHGAEREDFKRRVKLLQKISSIPGFMLAATFICPGCGKQFVNSLTVDDSGLNRAHFYCCRKNRQSFDVQIVKLSRFPQRRDGVICQSAAEFRGALFTEQERMEKRIGTRKDWLKGIAKAYSKRVVSIEAKDHNPNSITLSLTSSDPRYWVTWEHREATLHLKSHRQVEYTIPLPPAKAIPLDETTIVYGEEQPQRKSAKSRVALYALPLGDSSPYPTRGGTHPVSFHDSFGAVLSHGWYKYTTMPVPFWYGKTKEQALYYCVLESLKEKD